MNNIDDGWLWVNTNLEIDRFYGILQPTSQSSTDVEAASWNGGPL